MVLISWEDWREAYVLLPIKDHKNVSMIFRFHLDYIYILILIQRYLAHSTTSAQCYVI